MASILDWSTTASDNDVADSGINWLEGQDPNTVNNSARAMMGRVAQWLHAITGEKTTAGTADAQTLSTGLGWSSLSPMVLAFKAGALLTNTGAMTLNVDGFGAVAVKTVTGAALSAGAIVAGGVYLVAYESTAAVWILIGSGALLASALDADGTLAANSDAKIATQKATKTYVDQIVAATDAMVFKGVIDCAASPNYPAADRGWTYRVSVAGKIGGASGVVVENGDIILCMTDGTASGNQATVGSSWVVVQSNIDGAVVGPASVTDGNPTVFNGTTGKLIKELTWAAFRTAADLEVGIDFPAIVSTSTIPIGIPIFAEYTSASALNNGSTTSGANVSLPTAQGSGFTSNGQAQTGTWKNISGATMQAGGSNSRGYMVRTA